MMTKVADVPEIQRACSFREKWRYIPLPDSLKEIIKNRNRGTEVYEFGQLESGILEHCRGGFRSGAGLQTQYAQWLQEALDEGSWLKTSAVMSQFRAKKTNRVDVECPALVEPLQSSPVDPEHYHLLWARRWKNPDEHIGMKEARVALSSLKRTARVASLAGKRKLTLSDNLPAVLMFEKGRSSCPAPNRLCRSAAATQVGLGIRWRIRHVETKRNAADKPSRWFEHASPISIASATTPSKPLHLRLHDFLFDNTDSSREQPSKSDARECGPAGGSSRTYQDASREQTCHQHSVSRPLRVPPGLFTQGSFLEVFGGSGTLSKAISAMGVAVLPSLDIRKGPSFDLLRRSTQQAVKEILNKFQVSYVHIGTPCTVFSRARRNICNHQRARQRELVGCELAFFTAELCRLASSLGIMWSIENPRSSRLWDFTAIKDLCLIEGVHFVEFPMCQYGQPYKKSTALLTNCKLLDGLAGFCNHKKHDQVLRGRVRCQQDGVTKWLNHTVLAGAYPVSLCRRWAAVVKPLLVDASEEHRADIGSILESLERARLQQCLAYYRLSGAVETKFPRLLDSIIFGQHSNAEASKRREIRRRQQLANAV